MIRREHQRFSLRKYKVGVASVFLGFGLSFVLAGSGEAKAAETNAETAAPKTEVAAKAETPAATATPKAEAAVTETPAATPAKAEEATPAVTEAKPAAEETAKVEEAAKPEVAEGEAKKEEKAEEAKPTAEAKPATDESNKPKVRNRRAVTNEAVTGDHNSNPVAVSTYLKDGEKVTPEIRDANGATVSSQPVPAGYARKEGDWYTYAIWDLTEFNKRYGTKYYARAY